MKRVRVTRHAERDLDSIWRFIAADARNLETGDKVIDSIVRHFALLARQPEAGRTREDIAPDVRSFPTGNYLIYYRVSRSYLVISRILHSKRDQNEAWKKPRAT